MLIVCAAALLLVAVLTIMLYFARQTLRQEAIDKAEQTLDGTMQNLDNILLSVEQTLGNLYWDLLQNQHRPEVMTEYCKEVMKACPYIHGCAIAFEPYHFKTHGEYFMTYTYHESKYCLESSEKPIKQASTWGNKPYTRQLWYLMPIEDSRACWINPMVDAPDVDPIITFSLPIFGAKGKPVGVIAADVSVAKLSRIVMAAKPSPHSFAVLLDKDGTFIIHQDSILRSNSTVFTQLPDRVSPEMKSVVDSMLAGKRGYAKYDFGGTSNYLFFRPFQQASVPGRATEKLGWSIGLVYPESDIFGEYSQLIYAVAIIALIGLLILGGLCFVFTHRQLLPLKLLTHSAQRIAEGHYDETVPGSNQIDEVGDLQTHFQQMQVALAKNIGEQQWMNQALQKHNQQLTAAYEQAREAERMKTAVLRNMTNQMLAPVNAIDADVSELCKDYHNASEEDIAFLAGNIQRQGITITELLSELLEESSKAPKPHEQE